jgi:hypothetical protein
MKNIEDYLHFYVGRQAQVQRDLSPDALPPVIETINYKMLGDIWYHGVEFIKPWQIKPILRKLSSMTEEEWEIMFDLPGMSLGATNMEIWMKQFEQFECRPKAGFGKKWREQNPGVVVPTEKVCVTDGLKWEFYTYSPSAFNYLLKQGFDLFGLIDSGLAIDAATLNLESKEN